jgi:hypothetical protein
MRISGKELMTALFGTDYHGKECWFCFRRGLGCPGVIGKILEPTKEAAGEDITESILVLTNGWEKLTNGTYGPHNRAAFRSSEIVDKKRALKTFSHFRARLENVEAARVDLVSGYQSERDKAIEMTKRGERNNKRGYCWQSLLPAIIVCPSCHELSLVPSLRGPIDVKDGKVLK